MCLMFSLMFSSTEGGQLTPAAGKAVADRKSRASQSGRNTMVETMCAIFNSGKTAGDIRRGLAEIITDFPETCSQACTKSQHGPEKPSGTVNERVPARIIMPKDSPCTP
jgi:hypothetical protein